MTSSSARLCTFVLVADGSWCNCCFSAFAFAATFIDILSVTSVFAAAPIPSFVAYRNISIVAYLLLLLLLDLLMFKMLCVANFIVFIATHVAALVADVVCAVIFVLLAVALTRFVIIFVSDGFFLVWQLSCGCYRGSFSSLSCCWYCCCSIHSCF